MARNLASDLSELRNLSKNTRKVTKKKIVQLQKVSATVIDQQSVSAKEMSDDISKELSTSNVSQLAVSPSEGTKDHLYLQEQLFFNIWKLFSYSLLSSRLEYVTIQADSQAIESLKIAFEKRFSQSNQMKTTRFQSIENQNLFFELTDLVNAISTIESITENLSSFIENQQKLCLTSFVSNYQKGLFTDFRTVKATLISIIKKYFDSSQISENSFSKMIEDTEQYDTKHPACETKLLKLGQREMEILSKVVEVADQRKDQYEVLLLFSCVGNDIMIPQTDPEVVHTLIQELAQQFPLALCNIQTTNEYLCTLRSLKEVADEFDEVLSSEMLAQNFAEWKEKCSRIKDVYQSISRQLSSVQYQFQRSHDLWSESVVSDHNVVTSDVSQVLQKGIQILQLLHICEINWNELHHLLEENSQWLTEKQDALKHSKPCSKDDLENYISFYKTFRSDVDIHEPIRKTINSLFLKISSVVKCPSLGDHVQNFNDNYTELSTRIACKLNHMHRFSKCWTAFESDLHNLQSWLNDDERTENRIRNQIATADLTNENVIDELRTVLELQSKQDIYRSTFQQVEDALKQAINLNIYEEYTGTCVLEALHDRWTSLESCLQNLNSLLIEKISALPSEALVPIISSWENDLFSTIEESSLSSLKYLSDTQHQFSCYKIMEKELGVIQKIRILTSDLAASDLEQQIPTTDGSVVPAAENPLSDIEYCDSKFKLLQLKLSSKVDTLDQLVYSWTSFNKLSTELIAWLTLQEKNLSMLLKKTVQKNESCILEGLREIQVLTLELESKKQLNAALQKSGKVLNSVEGDYIKNQILDVQQQIFCHFVKLGKCISTTSSHLQCRAKEWESYHQILEKVNRFLLQNEHLMTICDKKVCDIKHLNTKIAQIKIISQNLTNEEQLLEELKNQSLPLRQNSEGSVEFELNTDMEMVQNRWSELQVTSAHFLRLFEELEIEWNTFSQESKSLHVFLNGIQNSVTALKLFHSTSDISSGYKIHLAELAEKDQVLDKLIAEGDHLCNDSSVLGTEAILDIKSCMKSLKMSLDSIKHYIHINLEEDLASVDKIEIYSASLQKISSLLHDVELSLDSEVLIDTTEEELISKYNDMQEILKELSKHYASLQSMRALLLQEQHPEPTLIEDLLTALARIQKTIASVVERYILLVKAFASKASFNNKCSCLLKLLQDVDSLLSLNNPSKYNELMDRYFQIMVMEVFILAHEPVILGIIENGLEVSNSMDVDAAAAFMDYLNQLQTLWNDLEKRCNERLLVMQSIVNLWYQYFYHLKQLSTIYYKAKTEVNKLCPIAINSRLISDHLAHIEEFLKQKQVYLFESQKCATALDGLSAHLDLFTKSDLKKRFSEIRDKARNCLTVVEERKSEMETWQYTLQKIEENLIICIEKLQETKQFLKNPEPAKYRELLKFCSSIGTQKSSISDVLSILKQTEDVFKSLDGKVSATELNEKVLHFGRVASALNCRLDLLENNITDKIEQWTEFHNKVLRYLDWCTNFVERVEENHGQTLIEMIKKVEIDLKAEIDDKNSFCDTLLTEGESLKSFVEEQENLLESLRSMRDSRLRVNNVWMQRLDKLKRLSREKSSLEESIEQLKQVLLSAEQVLFTPVKYNEPTRNEINKHLGKLQEVDQSLREHANSVVTMKSLKNSLLLEPDAFNNNAERNALDRACQCILSQWRQVEILLIELRLSIQSTGEKWETLSMALDCLEQWLNAKEALEAMHDFKDVASRDDYMNAVKVFEEINHSIQDDVKLKTCVNQLYRELCEKNLIDESDFFKNRVCSANNRWTSLFNIIIAKLKQMKDILYEWEAFESSRNHLYLFLTEIEMRLTEIDITNVEPSLIHKYVQDIHREFEEHEDALCTFTSLTTHLQQKSCPSDINSIQNSFSEIKNLWDRLRNWLAKLTDEQDQREIKSKEENGTMQNQFFLTSSSDTKFSSEKTSLSHNVSDLKMVHKEISSALERTSEILISSHPHMESSQVSLPCADDSNLHLGQVPSNVHHDKQDSPQFTSLGTDDESSNEIVCGKTHNLSSSDSEIFNVPSSFDTGEPLTMSEEDLVPLLVSESQNLNSSVEHEDDKVDSTANSESFSELHHLQEKDLQEQEEKHLNLLIKTLQESEEKLECTENVLRNTTPTGIDGDGPVYDYSNLLAACRTSIDVLRHLSKVLSENSQTLSKSQELCCQAEGVITRWESIEASVIAKESRAQSNVKKWQKLLKDIEEVEKWLSSSSEKDFRWETVGESVLKWDDLLEEHKELLSEMKNQKFLLVSLNELSQKFSATAQNKDNLKPLQARVKAINQQWESLCEMSKSWQIELRKALLQNNEFHSAVEELLLWLKETEAKVTAVLQDKSSDIDIITAHYNRLLELQQELDKSSPRVKHLQKMSELLVPSEAASDSTFKHEKSLHLIQSQLRDVSYHIHSLSTLCSEEMTKLSALLGRPDDGVKIRLTHSELSSEENESSLNQVVEDDVVQTRMNRCCGYMLRVARASFPIQALLLLLLGAAAIFPMNEEELSCQLANNFARSLEPMLRYPDGPPPV